MATGRFSNLIEKSICWLPRLDFFLTRTIISQSTLPPVDAGSLSKFSTFIVFQEVIMWATCCSCHRISAIFLRTLPTYALIRINTEFSVSSQRFRFPDILDLGKIYAQSVCEIEMLLCPCQILSHIYVVHISSCHS